MPDRTDHQCTHATELAELRLYRDQHEACRRELSLWLLEMENKHSTFGMLLERMRSMIVPA